jgi:hypothetical protein
MRDYHAFKRSAVCYWERRRIFYNLALVPPSFLTYMFGAGVISAGDPELHSYYVLLLFALSALGANICYTFAYGLEFFFGTDDPSSRWLQFGRPLAFALGTAFAMLLAVIGGRNIAILKYYYR